MLQTSTVVTSSRIGEQVLWSIEFIDPETEGRHHNEFLALSYAIDMIRAYAGHNWHPERIMTALPAGSQRGQLEQVFGCDVSHAHAVPTIIFDAAFLTVPLRARTRGELEKAAAVVRTVPAERDLFSMTKALGERALYDSHPKIEWVASKLEMTPQSLQRHLKERGSSFNRIMEDVLSRKATEMLEDSAASMTHIAMHLDYSDLAHFSRSFKRWTGKPPSAYRNRINP